ncbi:hypothetical protein TNCV_3205091 [Trichonephila clavipes]|nr:hypothetical protein TNCV_3205091 [Trichonephila clavipes]
MEHGNVSFRQAGALSLSLTLEFNRSYYLHITSFNNTDVHPLLSPLTPGQSTLDLNPISDLGYPFPHLTKSHPFKPQVWVHYTPLVLPYHWQGHKSLHVALGLISVLFVRNSQSLSLVLLECTSTRLLVQHLVTLSITRSLFLEAFFPSSS